MKYIGYILVLFLLVGCSDFQKNEQLKSIDALEDTINTQTLLLVENDIAHLDTILAKHDVLITSIEGLENDTIPLARALILDDIKLMLASIEPVEEQFNELKLLLEQETTRLKQLKKDINNASGKRKLYDDYISHESDKIEQLETSINLYIANKNRILELYETSLGEIYRLEQLEISNQAHEL